MCVCRVVPDQPYLLMHVASILAGQPGSQPPFAAILPNQACVQPCFTKVPSYESGVQSHTDSPFAQKAE